MISAALARLARVRVTLGYAALLIAVAIVLVQLGPHVRDQVIQQESTNLHNLSDGRLETLVGSAFVTDGSPIYMWLPGLVALLALAELLWRSHRLVVAFVVGHIGATLLVAVGLTTGLAIGVLSTKITNATDVGVSYGAVAVFGTLTAAISRSWRAAWTGWWLAVAFGSAALSSWDFTAVGHACALVLGMLLSTRFGRAADWTAARYALLIVAVGFGFMVIADTDLVFLTQSVLGLLGAFVADQIDRWLIRPNSSAQDSGRSVRRGSGGTRVEADHMTD